MVRVFSFLLLFGAAALAEEVRFQTGDGVEIVGDFYRGQDKAASVICIPMYRHTRATYTRLLLPLREKGFHVLVIDTRGHGESSPELAPKVVGRDAKLFHAMHLDVEAAIRFLEHVKGCDATRIGLVGASVGCSVAVDATVRNPHAVRAVVLLTPGSNYLGVPTLEHLKRWPGTSVFTFTSSEEQATSRGVMDALRPFDGSSHMVVPGSKIHGTRMFGKVGSIEELIANFLESRLSKSADVRVPEWREGDAGESQPRGLSLRRRVGSATYSLLLRAQGGRWTLSGLVTRPFKGTVLFTVNGKRFSFPLDTKNPRPKIAAKEGAAEARQGKAKAWFIQLEPQEIEKGARLSLEFRHSRGKKIRLPAKGDYAAHLQPARDG